MDSVLNVGAPAYAQWQHIQGKELDDVPEYEQKSVTKCIAMKKHLQPPFITLSPFSLPLSFRLHFFYQSDPKPTRMLLLNITDGTTDCQAMEYQPIPQVSVDTTPGTKVYFSRLICLEWF